MFSELGRSLVENLVIVSNLQILFTLDHEGDHEL